MQSWVVGGEVLAKRRDGQGVVVWTMVRSLGKRWN
jgi:hypothetical protein